MSQNLICRLRLCSDRTRSIWLLLVTRRSGHFALYQRIRIYTVCSVEYVKVQYVGSLVTGLVAMVEIVRHGTLYSITRTTPNAFELAFWSVFSLKAISPTITSFAYILYFELGKFSNERWCCQGRITAGTARRPRTPRTITSCAATSSITVSAIWNDTNSNKGRCCRRQTSGSNNWRWNRNGKMWESGLDLWILIRQ